MRRFQGYRDRESSHGPLIFDQATRWRLPAVTGSDLLPSFLIPSQAQMSSG